MVLISKIKNFLSKPKPINELIIPAPPMSYAVKPLREDKLTEVALLNSRCFTKGDRYSKATFRTLLTAPDGLSFQVLGDEKHLAGFIVISMIDAGTAHITTICIAPEHRRRGLASQLIERAEDAMALRGAGMIALEVRVSNSGAINLYSTLGYMITLRMQKYYTDGEDGLLMMKAL